MHVLAWVAVALVVATAASGAEPCAGRADALGTSRTLSVDPLRQPKVGTNQYSDSLALDDHEVVFTFDDGPLPPATVVTLDALAAECVKATFFVVGTMAQNNPALVRRIVREGHTVGTHTYRHPHVARLAADQARIEIDEGIRAAGEALGDASKVAPFIRFPYLEAAPKAEAYAVSKGLMVWSIDVHASDWLTVGPEQVAQTALNRIERRGRGILLLHDIHMRTAQALPLIFQGLKARNYRVVHVQPAETAQHKTASASR